MPTGCGNTVAFPFLATPCNASFHQLYAGMPKASTGAEWCCISDAFSSRVSWENSSFARRDAASSRASEGFPQEGKNWQTAPRTAARMRKILFINK